MRVYGSGSQFTVTVSAREVEAFNSRWQCSSLVGAQSFTFDRGDLVDRNGKGDGEEAVALSHDAQRYGEARVNRCRVELGTDAAGRPRRRYFATLETATVFAGDYFRRTGVVLGIDRAG